MAYFELRIGNTFKDENECDEFGEKLCKVDKSECVVMYSEKVQSELFSLKIYFAKSIIFFGSFAKSSNEYSVYITCFPRNLSYLFFSFSIIECLFLS